MRVEKAGQTTGSMPGHWFRAAVLSAVTLAASPFGALTPSASGIDLPSGYEQELVVEGLQDPSTMQFAPDGRLFIAERIQGRLRVAEPGPRGVWTLKPEPFYTFDVPHDGAGNPERYRSSGLRGFAFDPDFATNGHVYCFYMKHSPRHNRVVRITASRENPDVAVRREMSLLEMPFTGDDSSGSHNGGAVIFGTDGYLYITTGDGWNGGDNVQSLSTFTGKVLRIHPAGAIPTDNPFYDDACMDYRAIYALGLRNPFSCSQHPETGQIYINDVNGSNKARLYELEAGANYGHDGYGGIGTQTGEWGNAGTGGNGGGVITGSVWYPSDGPFPAPYRGACFATLWGFNGQVIGKITFLASSSDPTLSVFATNIGYPDPAETLKPVFPRIGPDGLLYYMASSYEADNAKVFCITPPPSKDCPDADNDGTVGVGDLIAVILAWGPCPASGSCPADVDNSGTVDVLDMLEIILAWGC